MSSALPIICLLITSLFILIKTKNPLHPAAFFSTVWASYVGAALVLCHDVEVSPIAIWWILGAVLSFILPGVSLKLKSVPPVYSETILLSVGYQSVILRLWVFCWLAGLCAFFTLIITSEKGLMTLTSLQDFTAMASNYTTLRYRGHSEPIAFRVFTPAIYLCPILGVFLYFYGSNYKKLIVFLSIIPAILVTAALTTKATILAVLLMSFSMALACISGPAKYRYNSFFSKKILLLGLGGGVFLVCVLVGVTMVRYEWSDTKMLLIAIDRLRLDFFGFLGPFSIWFNEYLENPVANTWGLSSLPGPFQLLGIKTREIGTYSSSVIIGSGRPSNIYTAFRGLIQDFGLLGSYVVLGIAGYAISWLHAKSKQYWFAIPVLGAFFYATLWSHVIFAFGYNTLIASWTLAILVLSAPDLRSISG